MAKSAGVPIGFIKFFHNLQSGLVYPVNDHLRNSVTPAKREPLFTMIDHANFYFTAIVSINGAR
jgi:hypothetical protein